MATSKIKSGRQLDTTLPKPTREDVKRTLGPFATDAQIDQHFHKYGLKGAAGSSTLPKGRAYHTPQSCIVHRIDLSKSGKYPGADLGFRCEGGASPTDEHGRTGPFPTRDGGKRTYPSVFLAGVRNINFRGMNITGEMTANFVLSPAWARCDKPKGSTELTCRLYGDLSSTSLSGARGRSSKKPTKRKR